MRIKKGRLRLSPNEEAQLIKDETEKRRKLRLQQVREQSKENASKIRYAVKQEKHKLLMTLATEIKSQLEEEKAERVRHLEQQYDNSLRNIGVGHKLANDQPDWSEERELVQKAENLRAEARGRSAMEKLKQETAIQKHEAHKHVIARKNALELERARAAEIAAMPPPPPDPLQNIANLRTRPVKVTDVNAFSSSHYHLQNKHAVDRAQPDTQVNAREAAEWEHERITERALELKRLRQDQLERARLRHNQALQKELLKHDYNNILHDLSDLQREDRERRLRIVHSIPKQVFEPPNFRMEDREDKQRQLEQEFEDMYMAGTDHMGDISLALDPQPASMTPSREGTLDVTDMDIESPLQEPTLPHVPPVLRDMTNMPKPKSPGKKPEKVLRGLMDRIKSQREEWMTSHSMLEVGEGSQRQQQQQQRYIDDQSSGGQFQPLVPDDSPMAPGQQFSPPEKLPRVQSPVAAPHVHMDRQAAMPPGVFADQLRAVNGRQQTNVQLQPDPGQNGSVPTELQQVEMAEILKQQELILEQKRELELKLQQLTYEQQKISMSARPPQSIQQSGIPQHPVSAQQVFSQLPSSIQQVPTQLPSSVQQVPTQLPSSVQQQFISSMSSSGMSQHPMNSIPPTHTTNSASMATSQGYGGHQSYMPCYQARPAYQPPSAVLTTDQLMAPPAYPGQQQPQLNGYHGPSMSAPQTGYPSNVSMATYVPAGGFHIATSSQGQAVAYPDHIPPSSLTTAGHTDQLTKVKEYQQYLLAKHEQSKKVLEETKEEIKRRRENLLQRYPKLDLSRLEDLGAKYLDNQTGVSMTQEHAPPQATVARSQGQSVPVTSLLASLAAHPYYAANLSQPGAASKPSLVSAPPASTITVGSMQSNGLLAHPDINLDTNLRKNKYDQIRKSLPFDADESLQMQTPVRMYEAYSQKNLDTTSGTEVTETDTSSLTERGSPALRPATWQPQQPAKRSMQQYTPEKDTTTEESEMDTTSSGSFLLEREDVSTARQDELYRQLAEIQHQKEEIIARHQMGQQRLQGKEEDLKAKLASYTPEDLGQQLRDSHRQREVQQPQPTVQKVFPTQNGHHPSNLSTIAEVDTPRPSDSGRLSTSSSEGGSGSQHSKRSLDYTQQYQPRAALAAPITEEREDVETQMQNDARTRVAGETIAAYSGSNISDVLERAKRFEVEVLEKLRKQTNAVLFDNEFDDSLEFSVSRRIVSGDPLSSGSLTPESFSTGPLDESSISKRERDLRSSNGSFQNSKSWADELSQFKIPSSDQSSLSFKVMKPESNRSSMEKQQVREDSVFTGDVNRFKVYSEINESGTSASSSGEEGNSFASNVLEPDTINAGDMLQHLRNLQQELRNGEETRQIMAQKLAEHERNASEASKQDMSQYSINSEQVSRPFMSDQSGVDLSQYSITDKSADISSPFLNGQSQGGKMSHDSSVRSGTSSQERELPVRRSPIGDNLRAESPMLSTNQIDQQQEVTTTEYSFTMEDSNKRSTSTPGEDRRKSALEGQTSISSRSELPSAITVNNSVGVRFSDVPDSSSRHLSSPKTTGSNVKWPGDGSDLSSYSVSTRDGSSANQNGFQTLSPDRQADSQDQDLTTYSISSAEESLEKMKHEFQKLAPEQPPMKIKTFAVSSNGDLISETSDSDISQSTARRIDSLGDDLSSYTLSSTIPTQNGSAQDRQHLNKNGRMLDSVSDLSSYSIQDKSDSDRQLSQLSEYTNKSSLASDSGESNPKSSSFTNVTSDPSMNMTGASNLSQYALVTSDPSFNMTGASGLSQYALNETRNSMSKSAQANENGNNYVQQRFTSLDNLISESKTLIARHKDIIDKNKQIEEVPNKTLAERSSAREVTSPQSISENNSAQKSQPPLYQSASQREADDKSKMMTDFARLSPFENSNQSGHGSQSETQNKTGDQSSNMDVNSLDYLMEHSSGITDEPLPDLTTMTLGSELSISEAFNKTEDLSDSENSLTSFEKHEMSDTESLLSTSRTNDDSTRDNSKADSLQDIVEARKYNFMVQAERRAAAVKERLLANHGGSRDGGSRDSASDDNGQVFRAVPVNVVREPTLSMSLNVSGSQRGRSPTTVQVKGAQSVSDAKKSFEAKEMEIKASMTPSKSPLNRALQPRGSESPRATDSGTKPSDSGSDKQKESAFGNRFRSSSSSSIEDKPGNRFRNSSSLSVEDKPNMGRLAGEIRQFGGSSGLSPTLSSPSTPGKTPPKVLPKPVRQKPEEPPPLKNPSGLSKTLSSWKKSRAVVPKPSVPETAPREAPKNSIKVLPQDAPAPLTEEERRQKAEDEQYEKKIRAYNPRLFRLQHKLDTADDSSTQPQKPAAEKPKESKKTGLPSISEEDLH